MAQTVIGIFKNSTEAQNAKQHLLQNGFRNDRIDIARQSVTDLRGSSEHIRQNEDFGDKVARFFHNLFGNEEESSKYSRAALMGTVITVHAEDAEEAEIAADILDDYGAVNVDEYSANPIDTGSSGTVTSESDQLGGLNSGRASVINTSGDTDSNSVVVDKDFNQMRHSMDTSQTSDQENQSEGSRKRSRIVKHPIDETNRLREDSVNAGQSPQIVGNANVFKDVDEKQETIREVIRNTELENDDLTARKQVENESQQDDENYDRRDDPRHQRPGII